MPRSPNISLMTSPVSLSEVGETGERVSPASSWMFDGEPGNLVVLGLFDQESAGLLAVR